jgi:hypothetical protein
MASIEQIIKDLEDLAAKGGVSGGSGGSGDRKKAAAFAKEALKNSKEFNKLDKRRIDLEIKALKIAQGQYKYDQQEYKVIGELIKSKEKLIESNEKLIDVTKKVGESFVGLGKAAFEGQGSISAFTDNVKGLGLIGNRLDINIETFRQLSQTGASFGKSIVDLREAAGSAALPLDDFAKLINENAMSIAAIAGTTTEGAKRIAELGRITREVGIEKLAPLGFTVDEINETLLLNLDSQRRTGVLDGLTRGQQRDSAIAFATELDRLAKLTGAQRDELRKQIEQQQSNERFQVALQGQTEETRRRLQGFAATVGNIAPGLNEGFQDLIANAGVPVTESALALVQNIPEARGVIQQLISGVITSEQALGRISAAASSSVGRFGAATVTGQVEFLRLQGDVINLGRRIVNVDGVFREQEQSVSSLVGNLTSFEQATKVLSSQFQGIETAMLRSFGPAFGTLIGGIQNVMGGSGRIATALASAPALTAGLLIAGLSGKFLFNFAKQVLVVAQGTAMGFRMARGAGLVSSTGIGRGKGKGAIGPNMPGKGFARSGMGRGIGLAGIGLTGLSAGQNLMDGDNDNNASAYGAIAGTIIGGILGSVIPGGGTLLGAGLGGMAGQAIGGMFGGGKALGGPMDAGKINLVGETGPELKVGDAGSAIVANNDLASIFNTKNLESQNETLINENRANRKVMESLSVSLNTLVATSGEQLKTTKKGVRAQQGATGNIITA